VSTQSSECGWLPELVGLAEAGGDWSAYVELLYRYFTRDFLRTQPSYAGRRWGMKRHPLLKGKEATFWHIISEGEIEDQRLPDLRRCERIRWPRPIIDACAQGKTLVWTQDRRGETRIAIAPDTFEYLVILADRGSHVLLWTAFPVAFQHQRAKLRREYEAFRSKQGG
jgi:hypothetical protein